MLRAVSGHVEILAYGDAAFAALGEVVDSFQAGDPLAPVVVVAPNASSRSQLGARLARRASAVGGLAGVRFVLVAELARALGEESLLAQGRRPLTRVALLVAVRATLASRAGLLGQVADHRSTAEELADRYEELRYAGPQALDRLRARRGLARELAEVLADVRALLEPSWYDDADVLASAIEEARRPRSPDRVCPVVVHLAEELRPGEVDLLGALAHSRLVVVHLAVTGDPGADERVHRLAERIAASGVGDLARAGRLGTRADAAPPGASPASRVQFDGGAAAPLGFGAVLTAPDAGSEVRAAVRLLLGELEAGASPGRCALVYSSPTPYRRLVAAALDGAGVPWSGPAPTRLDESPTARFASGLLAFASRCGRLGRAELVSWLASAPVRDRRGELAQVGEWDRVSRLVGVGDAEPRAFATRLRRLADEKGALLGVLAAEESRTGLCRAERTIGACLGMAELLDDLARSLERGRSAQGWADAAAWVEDELERYLGTSVHRSSRLSDAGAADELVLETLAQLAAVDGLDPSPGLAGFSAAFDVACERPGARRQATPGVTVGRPDAAVGLDLDILVVVGAVDGLLPRRAPLGSLLTREDRVAAGLDELAASDLVERDRRCLALALAGARTRVATVPSSAGRSGGRLRRSRFLPESSLDEVAASSGPDVAGRIASGSLVALHRAELEQAVLATAAADGESDLRHHAAVSGAPELRAGLEAVASRAAHRLGSYAGLAGPARSTGTRLESPTGLETLATCPFRYFLGHRLECEVVDELERRLEITPRDRGSIVHEVLERFTTGLCADARSRGTQVSDVASEASRQSPAGSAERMREIALETFARFERLGLTGKAVLWEVERVRLLAWLEVERLADEGRRRSGVHPIAAEMGFGAGGVPPVVRRLGNREVRFRGKVDRVERTADGSVVVVDYKTGSPRRFAGLSSDCVDRGRHLQLPVYALAAAAAGLGPEKDGSSDRRASVSACYRFVGDERAEVRFELTDQGLARLDETLGILVRTGLAGTFAFRPGMRDRGDFENCRSCDFSRVCPADRDRYWSVARSTAALAPYVFLVEGAEAGEAADPAEDTTVADQDPTAGA